MPICAAGYPARAIEQCPVCMPCIVPLGVQDLSLVAVAEFIVVQATERAIGILAHIY